MLNNIRLNYAFSSTRDYNESHVTSSVRMGKQEVNSWSRLMDTRSKNWCKAAEVVEPGFKKSVPQIVFHNIYYYIIQNT